MKAEPLKNKIYHNVDIVCGDIIAKRTSCCKSDDIKSAIEWLKEEINKLKVKNALVLADVYELIDKAFKDVIKR